VASGTPAKRDIVFVGDNRMIRRYPQELLGILLAGGEFKPTEMK
jgi:hypothetical protein